MTHPAADRVKALWSGTGTGTVTLGAAVSGEGVQAFPAELDGQRVGYLIKHTTADEAEAGIGVYTHSGTTLSRLYRTYPTRGGAAVDFSAGVKHVSNTPLHLFFVPNLAATDPGVGDDINDGYLPGMEWINTSSGAAFKCISSAAGAADWDQINAAGAAGALGDLTDVGTAPPTARHLLQANGTTWEGILASLITGDFRGAGVETLAAAFTALSGATAFTAPDDATDYSATSFKVGSGGASKNEQRRFTGNQAHLIEFVAANLTDGDYGWLIRGGTGAVTLVYNDISLNGGTSNIPLMSKVKWTVHEGGVLIDGGTGEPVDMEGVVVEDAELRDESETVNALGNQNGAVTADYQDGHNVTLTLTGNATSLTISNPPASGKAGWITFFVNHGTGPFTWAHPSGVTWASGTPPTLSDGASELSILTYVTLNGGTTWRGFLGGENFS